MAHRMNTQSEEVAAPHVQLYAIFVGRLRKLQCLNLFHHFACHVRTRISGCESIRMALPNNQVGGVGRAAYLLIHFEQIVGGSGEKR